MQKCTNWLEVLNESYETCSEIWFEGAGVNKEEFVCSLLGLTLYDSGDICRLFAKHVVEVAVAITKGKTFEYIEDLENYKWYLIMVNMPTLMENIDWGCSIRGAFWESEVTLNTCELFNNGEQLLDPKFTRDEWKDFTLSLEEFMNTKHENYKW